MDKKIMSENEINMPEQQENNRNPDGTFKEGMSGNPQGRPKGKGLKEYDREKFAKMTDEEKEEFLKTIANEMRYRMAEGNPKQDSEISGSAEMPFLLKTIKDDTKREDNKIVPETI